MFMKRNGMFMGRNGIFLGRDRFFSFTVGIRSNQQLQEGSISDECVRKAEQYVHGKTCGSGEFLPAKMMRYNQ